MIARTRQLAETFAERAEGYDRTATFPAADFDDIFAAGLGGPCVPIENGGLGLGSPRQLFPLWMMTKEIASVDMSLARCWEGHANSQLLLAAIANQSQQERWFDGIINRGEKWVSWSGEPQSRIPGQPVRFGTTTREVEGGYVVSGTKVFATSAGQAEWAILFVNTQGPGGARHNEASPESMLMLACDLSDQSVSFDDAWWDPIGMRGTVSYLAAFDETFIPRENLIGYPGQFLLEHWQTRFTPHYAATFLGAAQAAYDYAINYLTKQEKVHDPYVQHRVAEMSMHVDTSHLWLQNVAQLWASEREEEARAAGNKARVLIERAARKTVDHCIHACGARCLNRPSSLERVYRDLSFYVRHDNIDHVLAAIGRPLLGLGHDASFFKQSVTSHTPANGNSRSTPSTAVTNPTEKSRQSERLHGKAP